MKERFLLAIDLEQTLKLEVWSACKRKYSLLIVLHNIFECSELAPFPFQRLSSMQIHVHLIGS